MTYVDKICFITAIEFLEVCLNIRVIVVVPDRVRSAEHVERKSLDINTLPDIQVITVTRCLRR